MTVSARGWWFVYFVEANSRDAGICAGLVRVGTVATAGPRKADGTQREGPNKSGGCIGG